MRCTKSWQNSVKKYLVKVNRWTTSGSLLELLLPEDPTEVADHIAAGEVGVPFLQTWVAEVDPVD